MKKENARRMRTRLISLRSQLHTANEEAIVDFLDELLEVLEEEGR